MQDLVILVDNQDNQIGTAPKATVHTKDTPLHRAFSLYVFGLDGNLLLQQRKKEKITWGGFWSNSCCGHPRENEEREDAARRRVKEELGITVRSVEQIEPYRYMFEYNGITENEICPIFVATNEDAVIPDPNEIERFAWVPWSEFLEDIKKNAHAYSPWSQEQAGIMQESAAFKAWLLKNHIELT